MATINFKELGSKFGKEFQVLQYKKIYSIKNLPKNNKIELAFWGKSNVGKSSLINTLLNYKLNKVSKKPGCTRWIGFLELKNFNIIDLPGYSFAAVSKGRKDYFDKLFVDYIKSQRANKLFLLIDSFKGVMEIDEDVLTLFDCEKEILITKAERNKEDSKYLQLSTKNGNGIIELRNKILEIL